MSETRWVLAKRYGRPSPCSACGDHIEVLYRRYGEFDLSRMYCADCSVGQDPDYVAEASDEA